MVDGRTARRRDWKPALLVILLVVIVVLEVSLDLSDHLSPARITGWMDGAGALAPLLFIVLMALAVVISPIPSLPLDIVAGTMFGPIKGAFYAIVGATLGAATSFLMARFLGREILARHLRGHINFCRRCSDRLLAKVVFVSRLIPFVSFDLVSYGAGLTRMSLGRFTLATALGMIPLTVLYTSYGGAVLESPTMRWVGGIVMVLLLFLLPRWIERYDLFSMQRYLDHEEDEDPAD